MRKNAYNKNWTVDVDAAAQVRVQQWDLVRVQTEAVAWALARASAREHAEARAQVEDVGVDVDVEVQVEARAEWARVSAWAMELAEVHMIMKTWRQALGERKVQAWLRWGALEVCKVEGRAQDDTFWARSAHWLFGFALSGYEEAERNQWPRCRQDYWWLMRIISPITRLPPELLEEILLIVIDNDNDSPLLLMQVCKNWYKSLTGIWVPLKLGTATSKDVIKRKLEGNQWLLDILIDTEIDRGHFSPRSDAYQAIYAAMQAASRWRSLVVETFPVQTDSPEDLVNRGLHQCSYPVMSRLQVLIIKCPCEMSPLLERLLRILGNAAGGELTTVTINSGVVISFLVLNYSSIFRSVTVLSLDTPGLRNPVDLLPHLHQLEELAASHLPLPVYPDDVDLPFVHTLRLLTLRAVSIQWMSGKTFHVLENCTILFPLHRHVLYTFRTTLPTCKHWSFEGYPLDILSGVSLHKLTHLSVKCSASSKPQGNQQLALFSSQALQKGRLAPRILYISIEAMNEAWTKAFASMSHLEELVIDNAQPSSIGVKALQTLVILPAPANIMDTTAEWNTPACPLLKRFGLRYRRWLRPSEHFDLIPVFMSIIWSRKRSHCSLKSFRIWGSNGQNDPLELIDGLQISAEGFECLANVSAMTGQN